MWITPTKVKHLQSFQFSCSFDSCKFQPLFLACSYQFKPILIIAQLWCQECHLQKIVDCAKGSREITIYGDILTRQLVNPTYLVLKKNFDPMSDFFLAAPPCWNRVGSATYRRPSYWQITHPSFRNIIHNYNHSSEKPNVQTAMHDYKADRDASFLMEGELYIEESFYFQLG